MAGTIYGQPAPPPAPAPQQPQPPPSQGAGGAGNPLQPPMMTPTMSGFNTDPSAVIQQILTAFQPQAQSANQNFMDSMALSGMSGGPVQTGEAQLQGQLAAGLAPELGQAIQFAQGQGLQQALANAGFANQASSQNVGNMVNQQDLLAQMLQNAWGQQLGATTDILGGGMNAQNNISNQGMGNFGIQGGMGDSFGQLGGILGNMWAPKPGIGMPPPSGMSF